MPTKHAFPTSHCLGRENKSFPMQPVFLERANRAWMSKMSVPSVSVPLHIEGGCTPKTASKPQVENHQTGWPDLLAHKHTGGKSKTIPWHQYIALYKKSKIKHRGGRPPATKCRQKCYDPTLLSNRVCVQTPETQETSWGSGYNPTLQKQSRRLFFCRVKATLTLKGNFPRPSSCLVQLKLC